MNRYWSNKYYLEHPLIFLSKTKYMPEFYGFFYYFSWKYIVISWIKVDTYVHMKKLGYTYIPFAFPVTMVNVDKTKIPIHSEKY